METLQILDGLNVIARMLRIHSMFSPLVVQPIRIQGLLSSLTFMSEDCPERNIIGLNKDLLLCPCWKGSIHITKKSKAIIKFHALAFLLAESTFSKRLLHLQQKCTCSQSLIQCFLTSFPFNCLTKKFKVKQLMYYINLITM